MTVQQIATVFDGAGVIAAVEHLLNLVEAPTTILQVGCFSEHDTIPTLGKEIEVVVIHTDRSLLNRAKQNAPDRVFRLMDPHRLSYPAETFAGVWFCPVSDHPSPNEMKKQIKEFKRVLRPGGILCMILDGDNSESFGHAARNGELSTEARVKKLLGEAGFKILNDIGLLNGKPALDQPPPPRRLNLFAERHAASRFDSLKSTEVECAFCSNAIFETSRQIGLSGAGAILWGSDDLFVIPDIAPLVDGHLLMTTVNHHTCIGDCSANLRSEIRLTQQRIDQLFHRAYQMPTVFFEHGSARRKEAGSCVDHAHLHCVPTTLPIGKKVESVLGPGEKASLEVLYQIHASGQSYIYLEDQSDKAFVYRVDQMPCQFLRQIVTSLLGHQNWRWQDMCTGAETRDMRWRTLERLLPLADELNLERDI